MDGITVFRPDTWVKIASGLWLWVWPPKMPPPKGERTVIGAMSGSEGIVAILNEEAARRGKEAHYTTMSRVVKEIYDKVQDAYNGQWDEKTGHFLGYRTSFFTPEEIWAMAIGSENPK